MITNVVIELIFTHGTGPVLMYHIGEVPTDTPKYTDPTIKVSEHPSNRMLMQENLYALCLNALMGSEENVKIGL